MRTDSFWNNQLPDLTQPAMNNGSTCVWASESRPGESNYYQLVINRPNTTSPLAYTVCPFAIQVYRNPPPRSVQKLNA